MQISIIKMFIHITVVYSIQMVNSAIYNLVAHYHFLCALLSPLQFSLLIIDMNSPNLKVADLF